MATASKVFVDDVEQFAEEVFDVLASDARLGEMARLDGFRGQRAITVFREAG